MFLMRASSVRLEIPGIVGTPRLKLNGAARGLIVVVDGAAEGPCVVMLGAEWAAVFGCGGRVGGRESVQLNEVS